MNNGLMIDAVFALVLILGVVFGTKRGLFRSFMALAAIVLALIGASLLTGALTEPVTDMLMPRLEKSVEEWFDTESQTPQGDVPQIEGETPVESDASGETPNGDAAQDAENVRQASVASKCRARRSACRRKDAARQRGEDARVRAVLFGAHAAAPLSDRRH